MIELNEDEFLKSYSELEAVGFSDSNGYPTDEFLQLIQRWNHNHIRLCFDSMRQAWHMPDWGWREADIEVQGEKIRQYNISTGGWSGNEDIIFALESNIVIWNICWVQSRRGGHYIFDLKDWN